MDLETVAAQLYAGRAEEFIATRKQSAARAREDGDRELATQILALRKPTAAAWAINQAASAGALTDVLEFGEELRDAQHRLDGPTMQELGGRRGRIVRAAVDATVDAAKEVDPAFSDTASTRDQLASTLTASLADAGAAAAVVSGRLVTALSYAGFGEVDISDAVATPLRSVPTAQSRGSTRESAASDRTSTGSAASVPAESDGTADSADDSDYNSEGDSEDDSANEQARADAEQAVERARRHLDVAQQAYEQARSRRHQARLALREAEDALDSFDA